MLKYVGFDVVFREIPDETTLAINISNCPCHCKGCHSSYLAEDIGQRLDVDTIVDLVTANNGITCVALMGGDSEPESINELASYIRNEKQWNDKMNIKIAWYSGRSECSTFIDLNNFDFIKLGPYIEELGGLDSRETNQILLQIDHIYGKPIVKDITAKFWNHDYLKSSI